MASAFSPPRAQDLINAVALLEQDKRLPEEQCRHLRELLAQRGRKLDFLCDRAVRLAGLMCACEPQGYLAFLYVRLEELRRGPTVLNATSMLRALLAAQKSGRLAGQFACDETGAKDAGVEFLLARDDYHGVRFTLEYRAMPLAAGFLEFFLNAAEPAAIVSILGPVGTVDFGDRSAGEKAAAMREWLEGWLDERTISDHHIRQAATMRKFLQGLAHAQVVFSAQRMADAPCETAAICFPKSTAAAGKARLSDGEARHFKAAAGNDNAKAEWMENRQSLMDDFQRRMAGGANVRIGETAPEATGKDETDSFSFDGWRCDPVPATDWHRRRWPKAYAAFRSQRNERVSEDDHVESDPKGWIGDETILLLWLEINRNALWAARLGFRKYRQVAISMIHFKRAASLASSLDNPDLGMSTVDDDGNEMQIEEGLPLGACSPLRKLQELDDIKWLQKTRLKPLCAFMEAGGGDDAEDESGGERKAPPPPADGEEDESRVSSLFVDGAVDASFARTLLRYKCFGDAQELSIKRSRDVAQDYCQFVEALIDCERALRQVGLATVHSLLARQDICGLTLLETLRPGSLDELGLEELIRGGGEDERLEATVPFALARLTDKASELGAEIRRAYSDVNRIGFRKTPNDLDNPEFNESLARGAEYLPLVIDIVGGVARWYASKTSDGRMTIHAWLNAAYEADSRLIFPALHRMYMEGAE